MKYKQHRQAPHGDGGVGAASGRRLRGPVADGLLFAVAIGQSRLRGFRFNANRDIPFPMADMLPAHARRRKPQGAVMTQKC